MPWYVHEIVGALTGAAAVFFAVTLWIHVDNQRARRAAKQIAPRPPAGTFTPEERSEEYRGGPVYMDTPYTPLPERDHTFKVKWDDL